MSDFYAHVLLGIITYNDTLLNVKTYFTQSYLEVQRDKSNLIND